MIIVGVDVSKSTLDLFLKPVDTAVHISNDTKGFKQWFKVLRALMNQEVKVMVIMEHTGRYSLSFESFLQSRSIDYCKVAALEIKRSVGMKRGKDDKTDAQRIAEYGWLRREILTADHHPDQSILTLGNLLSLRAKMVRDRGGYIARLKEMRATTTNATCKSLISLQQKAIAFFTQQIIVVDRQIKALIASDEEMKKTFDLLITIKGIGWVIASHMIRSTYNFRRFINARKFNCYVGIAPFKNESGSSKKVKSRISHLANKTIKSLLDRGASTAIQHDQEMKSYYQRRVKEGKSKRSTINIVRAKLVARMFAVIKRQTPYQTLTIAA